MEALGLTSTTLHCDCCGYDLRAQPADGKCPECGASVAESRRLVAIPRRPAWRDSDPRWRLRMVAGMWVLVFVPLMALLKNSGWAASITVPTPLDLKGRLTLDETFAFRMYGTYEYLVFCIGVVLLFSKERNRRASRLDWTRRWGLITSYLVFLLGFASFAFITSLVMVGIAALFLSMPPRFQPVVTGLLIKLGAGYLSRGPYPGRLLETSLPVFSAIVVLLACVPLFNALRSSGPKWLAALLLSPLFMASLVQLTDIGRYGLGLLSSNTKQAYDIFTQLTYYPFYFNTVWLVQGFASTSFRFIIEAGKWCACLIIATWLSVAQIMAWRRRSIKGDAITR